MYGVPPVKTATIDYSRAPGHWALRFVRPREDLVHEQALDALRLGLVDLHPFVSHVLPLAEIERARALLDNRQVLALTGRTGNAVLASLNFGAMSAPAVAEARAAMGLL